MLQVQFETATSWYGACRQHLPFVWLSLHDLQLLLLLQTIAENVNGLMFKNKRDRKVINVDPRAKPGDNSTRLELVTDEYLQVGWDWA